ncbi:hypothetical protein FA15DRAFT_636471 [Coprinopsis marcescibilis]|uniref:holo-[acyl-carrier-protein] synthase n=1 Tax=Coprinopsis marcescibilis TaxID=230819 RepID=A0A5C3L3E2_COPMA|nr:hypothetical protein FA15DRAFT_636471 [Coprinopsis marcescibilis]
MNLNSLRVQAALYHSEDISEELYLQGLSRVHPDSQTRIRKFYRRDDACRTLIGDILVRLTLQEAGKTRPVVFSKTTGGKPYIVGPPDNHIGFNVTHDNSLVAVAFAPGVHNPPSYSVGIDVMKTQIAPRERFPTFLEAFEDQLTPLEFKLCADDSIPEEERIRHFFWMWTLKEAYTKALGIGLGFNFSRVEFNVAEKQVKVDGHVATGWRFTMFIIKDRGDLYEGVVAEYMGGDTVEVDDKTNEVNSQWLKIDSAVHVLKRAIETLSVLELETGVF